MGQVHGEGMVRRRSGIGMLSETSLVIEAGWASIDS